MKFCSNFNRYRNTIYVLYIKLFFLKKGGGGLLSCMPTFYIRGRFPLVWKAEKVVIEGKNQISIDTS